MTRPHQGRAPVLLFVVLFLLVPYHLLPVRAANPGADRVDATLFQNLTYRNIGPAIMGGRLTDIEGVPGDPRVVYVAAASGGVWKTTDGGVTWTPIFDQADVQSIGDLALAPGNPDVVWVGTGEDNPRNSVSFGNGVYKSTDGGRTWKHMGLADTERIARILVHPTNPDIVYVAAIGHVFGPNPNRGVYMTTDGGRTWKKVLYIDEYHGASDLEMDPRNPNILYAGMWYFQRRPWDFDSGSEKGGVFRSLDGGRTWHRLTEGLPRRMGRIGIKVAPSEPNRVYVLAEAKAGALFRSDDRGDHFRTVSRDSNIVNRGFYYTELRIDPQDANRVYAISSRLWLSIDGGRTFRTIARGIHVDFHTMWIDPRDPNRIWLGNDGGLAVSYNRGKTWEYVNNLPLAQFYQIHADQRLPFYYVCGGLQDNGTWCAPHRTREFHGILNDHWYMVSFGDGFHIVSHPDRPNLYLSESQGGGLVRTDMATGEAWDTNPQPKRNDGGPVRELKYRFNWNAPIVASPHDPRVVYFAGNVVFRSPDFGLTWEVISPDLTTNDPDKQKSAGGPIFPENTTAEYHCTIISLAESPVQPGLIWAGTDDGNLQVTTDGGRTWTNVIKNVRGLPPNSPVSHVEPSRTAAETAYVAFDRHMFDDFRPLIYRTTDLGRHWQRISDNLPPRAYVHVVREDPRNPQVLYAGTELGLFVTWDQGRTWHPLRMQNLPAVAVHDILVHPRENDLILGTHGRGIWIFDDATPIQQIRPEILDQPLYLFDIRPALHFARKGTRVFLGNKTFVGPNPPYGAIITYYVREAPDPKATVQIEIRDDQGRVIRKWEHKPKPGLNRTVWDLAHERPEPRREREQPRFFFFGGPRGPRALPGTYTVRLTYRGQTVEKRLEVRLDPTLQTNPDDLRKQLEVSLQLRDMITAVNRALRTLDSVESQIRQHQKTLRAQFETVPADVQQALQEHLKKVAELKRSLNRETRVSWREGNKLLEHLRSLLDDIQSPFRAPTPYQMAFFQELQETFRDRMQAVRTYLTDDIGRLNERLARHQIPGILARPPETRP